MSCDTEAKLRECLEQYIEGFITYPEMAFCLAQYQNRVWHTWMDEQIKKAGLGPVEG